MMNEIHMALEVLGLQAGATLPEIRERYIVLAHLWHPDRLANGGKGDEQEELKEINSASALLEEHFAGNHAESGCCCQAEIQEEVEQPNHIEPAREPEDPEEMARLRDELRRLRAANSEVLVKPVEANQVIEVKLERQDSDSAKLRWKIAKLEAVAFLVILALGWVTSGMEHWRRAHANSGLTDTTEVRPSEQRRPEAAEWR